MSISEIIATISVYGTIFGIPSASLIWLIVSVIRYVKVPKTDSELRKKRRIPLVTSAIISGVLVLSFIGLMIMFLMAMRYM